MLKNVLLSILSFFILIFNVVSVSANNDFDGRYNSKFQFRMGAASVCPRTLPIEIELQVTNNKIVGTMFNNGGGNTHQFCKLYHNGSLKGSVDNDGKIISLSVKQNDGHSMQYSSFKISGKLDGNLTLLSRNSRYHPPHKFSLEKRGSSKKANKVQTNDLNSNRLNKNEIICSDRKGSFHAGLSQIDYSQAPDFKKYFPESIKLTNDLIYSSTNKNIEAKHNWELLGANLRDYDKAMISDTSRVHSVFRYTLTRNRDKLMASVTPRDSWRRPQTIVYSKCLTVADNSQNIKNDNNLPNSNLEKLCDLFTPGLELNTKTYKSIQKNLKTLGYYKGGIDGLFGKGSCKSLNSYRSATMKLATKYFSKSLFDELQRNADAEIKLANKKSRIKEDASVCDKATILQNGIRRWNLDNPKAIKQVKSRGLDCGITVGNTPFTQKEAKYFLSQLMAFVSENPSEFGLNFATEFNKVRDITSGKWNSNLSKTFELFRGYTSEFPLFQKYLEDIRLAEAEAKQVRLEQLRETAAQDMIVLREWAQKNVLDEKAAQIASLDAKFGDKNIQTINGLEQLIAETKRLFSATGIKDTVAQNQTNEIVNSLYDPSSIYLFANVSGDATKLYKNLDGEFSFEQSEGTYCASNKLDAFDYYVLQGKIFTTFNDLSKLTSSCSASADVFVVKGNEITSDTVFNVIKLDKLQQVLEVPKSERDTAFNQLNFLKDTIKKDVIAGDRIGYGLLKTDSKDSSICAVIDGSEQGHVDQLQQSASLLKALSYPWNGFNKITNNAEEAFKSLQRGQCSSVYGSALTLGRLYLAGETAGINMEFMPVWVSKSAVEASQKSYDATLADSANANAKLEQSIKDKEKLDEQAKQSKAELASVRQLDLREKNGLRFMVLRDELQAQVFSAVKFAFENPADEAGYIKKYLSQSFVDQSTRYSPYDGIISDIQKLAAERWEITEQRIEQVDYGKAKFNGRELDAIEVELRIASKNRLVGKYSEYCQRIHVIKDDDFEMWRNFEIGNCDVTSATRKWKNASSFESLWIVEAK